MTNRRRLTASSIGVLLLFSAGTARADVFTFSTAFNGLSADESLFGVAALDGGVLKLINSGMNNEFGDHVLALGGTKVFNSFSASWRSLVGGGTSGGADGYSFNVAADLPSPPTYFFPGEQPAGTGLSVSLDTFDNCCGDVVGIQLWWKGVAVASQVIPKDDDGSGNFLRKNTFVDALLTVTPGGLASFTYDGNTIQAILVGFTGLQANQTMFGARTGGATDNHWIDDLSIRAESASVPEPTTLVLGGLGLVGLAYRRRNRVDTTNAFPC